MAFNIVRNDITKVIADAIVNTANPFPVIGRGTDSSIYNAAGREKLLAERKKIGAIKPGNSVCTDSFNLKRKGIKHIIHTVATPFVDGGCGESDILRNCYSSSLNLAKKLGCKSVAVPLLGTGFYSFPKELGLKIAVDQISSFLSENEIDVILVVFDQSSYLISEKLFDDVQSFIDDNYTGDDCCSVVCQEDDFDCLVESAETSVARNPLDLEDLSNDEKHQLCEENFDFCDQPGVFEFEESSLSVSDSVSSGFIRGVNNCLSAVVSGNVKDVDYYIDLSKNNLSFQNTLQHFIAEKNVENAAVYKKAFIDRKFFSKIISTKNYVPKKMTVMALGLALELSMVQFESFLASAGYAFMPSSKFDVIVKFCVENKIFNLVEVDLMLDAHGECCFASE